MTINEKENIKLDMLELITVNNSYLSNQIILIQLFKNNHITKEFDIIYCNSFIEDTI